MAFLTENIFKSFPALRNGSREENVSSSERAVYRGEARGASWIKRRKAKVWRTEKRIAAKKKAGSLREPAFGREDLIS